MLRSTSGDFIIETRISDGFEGRKLGGLLMWKDSTSFAWLAAASRVPWHDGYVYYEASVSGRLVHSCQHPFEADEVWLRLERKGDRFTGYVSKDGENWYLCGWADIPIEDPIQVGIYAFCRVPPATSTRFEYFKLYRPSK